jgi:predicted secreted Zn-dependent protease
VTVLREQALAGWRNVELVEEFAVIVESGRLEIYETPHAISARSPQFS